jgi:Peptidase family M41
MARLLLGEYLLLSTQELRDLPCVRRAQLMHVARGCEGFNLEDGIILVVSLSKKFTLTDMVTGIAYTGVFCLVMCQFVPHRGRKGICLSVVACGPRMKGNFSAAASRHEQEVISLLIEGRTAEELVFHEIATGARDDLARATDIARSRVMHCGMSEKLGPLTYERGHRPPFLDPPLPLPQLEVSEETTRDIDCEVRTLIGEAHERAQKILETERHTLDTLAHLLLKTATIEGDELRAIMDAVRQQARTHAIAMRVYQLS